MEYADHVYSHIEADMKTRIKQATKPDDIVDYYDSFCQQYSEFYQAGSYVGPRTLCQYVAQHVEGRTGLEVLDVGAGSGWVAIQLKKILQAPGRVDALEPSVKMLEEAQKLNLYDTTYTEVMKGYGSTSVQSGQYDLVISCGAFIPNHIPLEGLYEFNRVTKIGGLIAIAMREDFIQEFPGYRKLYATLDHLEETGVWTRLHRLSSLDYFNMYKGALFIYRKQKDLLHGV